MHTCKKTYKNYQTQFKTLRQQYKHHDTKGEQHINALNINKTN